MILPLLLCTSISLGVPPRGASRTKSTSAAGKRVSRERLEGGVHWTIHAPEGTVHVWRPGGYQRARAGIVLYIHGHHIRVDRAWKLFDLAAQFRESRQNALFIVPEAPRDQQQKVNWPALGGLLRRVARACRIQLPRGHVVAVAHSGGYRTVVPWLDYRWLNHIILLDALYGNTEEFHHWIHEDKRANQHKLVLVGSDTHTQSLKFTRRLRYGVHTKEIPDSYRALSRQERRTRLLYLKSQYGHNEMIKNSKVLPLLLRNTRLKHL